MGCMLAALFQHQRLRRATLLFLSSTRSFLGKGLSDSCEHPWRIKAFCLRIFFFICFVSFHLRKSEAGMVWSNHEKIHFPVMGVTKMPACICGTGIRALNCVGYSRTLSSLLCSARCLLLPWLELGRVLGAPGRSLPSCPVLLGWELMPCYHPRLSGAVYWSPC